MSLQLRLGAAATTVGRFAVNSTFGVGGLFDVATRQNLPHQSGDLGQTLYVWGMRDSPYLVLPVIGPTNVRDLIGTTVEFAATLPAGGAAAGADCRHGQQPNRRRLGCEPVHEVGPSRPDAGARGELDRLLFHAAQRCVSEEASGAAGSARNERLDGSPCRLVRRTRNGVGLRPPPCCMCPCLRPRSRSW